MDKNGNSWEIGQPLSAVFLDRDGVINEEVHHLNNVNQLKLLPGTANAIKRVNTLNIPVVVVTNQSVIARGICSEEQLAEIHLALSEQMEAQGATIARFYYCPHHPTAGVNQFSGDCMCRKPKPGMLVRAAQELGLTLKHSVIIGDNLTDLQAGWRAGCGTVLVCSGMGEVTRQALRTSVQQPDYIAKDLGTAVDWILKDYTNIETTATAMEPGRGV